MATINDDLKEDPLHSHFREETLSPEDLAWADSCLNKDVDVSETDWGSIKDALLEILSSQQEPPVNSSAAQSSTQLTATADRNFHSTEYLISEELGGGSDQDEDFIDDDFGEVESIDISEDEGDGFILKTKRSRGRRNTPVNVFRPNYSEDVVDVPSLDSDLNMTLTAYEEDPFQEDIFKVWDLGVSDMQDDFTKQLNKALDEVPPQVPNANDSVAFKDLTNVSIDDIIAGIGDLSLKQYTD